MKKLLFYLVALSFVALFSGSQVYSQDHETEKFQSTSPTQTGEYIVQVNGKEIPVYCAKAQFDGGIYYFASFDFEKAVNVKVISKASLDSVKILPAKYSFKPKHCDNSTISFRAVEPFRVSVERDGRNIPLMIFGNRPDEKPQANENVIVLGPGLHDIPVTELTSGQMLYLEEGAVLRGAVIAKGDDITIAGKGIITGDGYAKLKGPAPHPIYAENCHNLTVRDIIITNPWHWTFVMKNCDGVLVDNIKMCCSNILNDDATDICNSRNVCIKNSFFRVQDDVFAIKGINPDGTGRCEHIYTENCEVWTDKANVYRIGYECDSEGMNDIYGKNIDVIHYSRDYRLPSHYWSNAIFWIQPSNGMMIENCRFEDIRINAAYNDMILIEAKCCFTSGPSIGWDTEHYQQTGSARNIVFKNITVDGDKSVFKGEIVLEGYDEKHYIKNIQLENIVYFGEKIK